MEAEKYTAAFENYPKYYFPGIAQIAFWAS
jgi:hypothetical protein